MPVIDLPNCGPVKNVNDVLVRASHSRKYQSDNRDPFEIERLTVKYKDGRESTENLTETDRKKNKFSILLVLLH
ncbi:hypothetical protein RRG08_036107 [Elysia crispata]|uniref:Uncharacterized protein n=1 Tax=Elysia crispata TaxID=231223 RepID=A0AAE1AKV9_9GAST|nr:hypothetical protein RRG08_036107 [Elysia crispata]